MTISVLKGLHPQKMRKTFSTRKERLSEPNMTSQAPPRQSPYSPPEDAGLSVVYADEWLLCVNKAPGLLTTPGRGAQLQDCLITRLQKRYPEALVVHRLDEATSGLVLFARSLEVQRALSRAFETRAVEKTYIAVVHGLVDGDEGEINLPIGPDWPRRPLQKVDHQHGKPALTHWRVVARDEKANTTRLELKPQTGRTHQLRVHMQALGHAIVGDALYGDLQNPTSRLMLHAAHLQFEHPVLARPIGINKSPEF
jgi:tRNA pseudouridine32 synthase / 23S rRNA pseudouridine746 synthase